MKKDRNSLRPTQETPMQAHLAQSSFGRILPHLLCVCRNHKCQWHLLGIQRELRCGKIPELRPEIMNIRGLVSTTVALFCFATSILIAPMAHGQRFESLYSFHGSDGANPLGSLVQGGDGALYGVTYSGPNGCGTAFKIRSEEHTSELQSRLHLVC